MSNITPLLNNEEFNDAVEHVSQKLESALSDPAFETDITFHIFNDGAYKNFYQAFMNNDLKIEETSDGLAYEAQDPKNKGYTISNIFCDEAVFKTGEYLKQKGYEDVPLDLLIDQPELTTSFQEANFKVAKAALDKVVKQHPEILSHS